MSEPTPAGEALAAALRRHLLQRFPADRAYPRDAFHDEGMPPPVAAFLDRTLDRWVEMERDRFREDWASTGWFDADDADVQRAEREFFDTLGHTARVPAEAWEDTLGGAVDLVVRFLTVPARALTDAIFEGAPDPLPADTVRARLSLFGAYPYLADVAAAYLDRKRPEALDPPELFALLDRIDRRFVSEYGREDWLSLLAPLFALVRHTPSLDGVPTPLLQRFFEAKGEDELAGRVAEYDAAALDETALRDALAPAFPDAPTETLEAEPEAAEPQINEPEATVPEVDEDEVAPAPTTPTAAPRRDENKPTEPPLTEPEAPFSDAAADESDREAELDAERGADAEHGADTEHEAADDTAARPLWERFAEHTSDGDSVNARFGAPELDTERDVAAADDADAVPLWKRFFARPDAEAPTPNVSSATTEEAEAAPTTGASPERPADSLDSLEQRVLGPMPPAQRKRFIKHIFNGDAGKYVTVLHALETAGSWTEASQIIARDVFRPSRINIYGEHAVAFTDAVEARFRK